MSSSCGSVVIYYPSPKSPMLFWNSPWSPSSRIQPAQGYSTYSTLGIHIIHRRWNSSRRFWMPFGGSFSRKYQYNPPPPKTHSLCTHDPHPFLTYQPAWSFIVVLTAHQTKKRIWFDEINHSRSAFWCGFKTKQLSLERMVDAWSFFTHKWRYGLK